ncbi:glycine zipper 2TM domain-containing protein [Pseudomarimonas arenosa]|uniref:Glycine zipper 2TM domain-containing protein n=1 Tax=Pseudomarimonas arenosa TaxID=2774145 RepID=A0AAW3ZRD9_9GAMM|nr:glycine zipper 2TM domain-containing protein [Pseudomarimonas arenosa]MBD8527440.1 glycine zipper 2TM domain-containing protein [Pseudomarimonas arenosa]
MKIRTANKKRPLATGLALLLAGLSGSAFAEHNERNDGESVSRLDRARVTRVEQMERQPDYYSYQECWNEQSNRNEGGYYRDRDGRLYRYENERKSSSTAGAIIGAIVGGALGNQVGDGSGRKAATIAGAVIGAGVGKHANDRANERANDRQNRTYEGYDRFRDTSGSELRCRTVTDIDYRRRYGDHRYPEYTSYRVTYAYAGHSYQSITNQRPGRFVQVRVDVQLQD